MGAMESYMGGVFRAGHNKPSPRNRAPLKFDPPESAWRRRRPLLAVAAVGALLAAGWAIKANAQELAAPLLMMSQNDSP